LLHTGKITTDYAIAAQLELLAEDYGKPAETASLDNAAKAWLDPLRALNTSGIHDLIGSLLQRLSGRPEIEFHWKVDPRVGKGASCVSACKLWCTRRASFKMAVQVPGLGLELRGLAGLQTKIEPDFRELFRVAAMSDATSTVLVIDDDPDIRASVGRLLRSLGINVQLFASISDFLKSDPLDCPSCLVLDIRLPGQSGLDFQRELAAANKEIPIIFITGHGDIPMSVQAMKQGAIEFLTKPFRDQDLLDAIQLGFARDRARRENDKDLVSLRQRFASLSPREREIVIEVARGRLSKQIAHDIGIAEATVKVHRARAMQKMQAGSLPELGRMADRLKLVRDTPQRS
jgi:FixJ family two-component response regulator